MFCFVFEKTFSVCVGPFLASPLLQPYCQTVNVIRELKRQGNDLWFTFQCQQRIISRGVVYTREPMVTERGLH